MSDLILPQSNRRQFIKSTGQIIGASALAGITLPHVHAQGSDQIRLALIGCGGRGTGAAGNAMVQSGAPKLVAMADVFEPKLSTSYNTLKKKYSDQVEVPEDQKFIGFDGYKKAMDCLKKGDIAIFTTPLAFRWVHFQYAIEKGLNVFMEKPVTADGPSSRKMLELSKLADEKGLRVAVGLNSRHSRAMQELHKRIQDGEIGDITYMRGYRMQGPIGSAFTTASMRKPDQSELLFQISRFHSFLWASGGAYSDFYIHHIDQLSWMKNAWPVKAQAVGGRHYKTSPEGEPYIDQNFDSYAVEYIFEDGTRLYMDGRCMIGANSIYSSYVHGTKGMAIAAKSGDAGLPSSTYSSQNPDRSKMIWTSSVPPGETESHVNEWTDFIKAIHDNVPYNEVPRGVYASVVTSMGRMAAHTAQEITFDQMLNHEMVYAPGVENLTMDSEAFLKADDKGRYPVPEPGIKKDREY